MTVTFWYPEDDGTPASVWRPGGAPIGTPHIRWLEDYTDVNSDAFIDNLLHIEIEAS